jgi:hypothetical protein
MPPVIIPIGIALATAGAGVAIGTVTVAAAVTSVASTAVFAGASYLLADRPGGGAATSSPTVPPAAAPANNFRTVSVRQPVPARRFILGRVRTAGVMAYIDNDNPNLYYLWLLSDGQIEGVQSVYLGETLVPLDGSGDAAEGSLYFESFTLEATTGAEDQAASAILTAAFTELTSDFRQRGIARVVTVHHWGDTAADHQTKWSNALEPTFLVEGALVFDQREVAHDVTDRTTWEYSTNPAWLIAFILMNAWDVSIAYTDLDLDSFETAADAFDATLTYNEDTVKLFELAGIVQSGHQLAAQVDDMLRSCGAVITYSGGKYGLAIDEAKTSVWTITDSDVIEVGEYQAAGNTDETPTAVKARFYDQDNSGLQATTPTYLDAAQATEGYREAVLDLGFTPKNHSAQILAYRDLQKARDGRRLELVVSDAGLYLQPLERVTVSFDNASFLNGEYSVVQVDLDQNGCILSLVGYVAGAYTDPTTYLV